MQAMVIDDSRAMRLILTRIAGQLGFDVVEAGNGREALDRLAELETDARAGAGRLEHAGDERAGVRRRRFAQSRGTSR